MAGVIAKSLSSKYNIQSYPSIVYIAPNTNGTIGTFFDRNPRNYESLKKWILDSMGEEEISGVTIPLSKEEQ